MKKEENLKELRLPDFIKFTKNREKLSDIRKGEETFCINYTVSSDG